MAPTKSHTLQDPGQKQPRSDPFADLGESPEEAEAIGVHPGDINIGASHPGELDLL